MDRSKLQKNQNYQDLGQNPNKKLFFLVAMPRSGNTLFASIMNQNPEIAATANSITLEIMKDLFLLKQTDVFQNFQDHKSLDNVLDIVFDTYYKDWPQRIIIDRGPVMTTGNFQLMQKHFKRPFKCIVLLRDLMDVLASYMQWYTENPSAFPNRYNCKNDEEKLSMIMNKNMVTNPEQEFKKIYKFLDEPYYLHYFDNLQSVKVNGIEYNDTIVGNNMHKLFSGPVRKVYNPHIEKIPQRIKEKYGHIRF